MNLDKVSVTLRPRQAWQSMDLGFMLARQWYLQLFLLWCVLSVPVYLLCKLLGIYTGLPAWLALLIWWWFKPLYEAPLYFWCSRALFQESVTFRQALSRARENFLPLLGSYLFMYRPDAGRSQNMNVIMLEGLRGKQRSQRLKVIRGGVSRNLWLITVCVHIEVILLYSALILIYLMTPGDLIREVSLLSIIESNDIWITTLMECGAVLAAGLVAPFYVAAGFTLYINRRTHLEAWDVEVQFQRLLARQKPNHINGLPAKGSKRASVSSLVALCVCLVTLAPVSTPLEAASTIPDATTSKAVIEKILENEEFGGTRTERSLFNFDDDNDSQSSRSDIVGFALAVERFLWFLSVVVGLVLTYYLLRNLHKIPAFKGRLGFRRKNLSGATLFDLDITPESLPTNIPAAASQLLDAGENRAALSLLYRSSLSRLVHEHGMLIHESATENQCLEQVSQHQPELRSAFFSSLTRCWLQTAYGRKEVEGSRIKLLCQQWTSAFATPRTAS